MDHEGDASADEVERAAAERRAAHLGAAEARLRAASSPADFHHADLRAFIDRENPEPGLRRGAALEITGNHMDAPAGPIALVTGAAVGCAFGGKVGDLTPAQCDYTVELSRGAVGVNGVHIVGRPDRNAWVLLNNASGDEANCCWVRTTFSVSAGQLLGDTATPGPAVEVGEFCNLWIVRCGPLKENGVLTISYGSRYRTLPGVTSAAPRRGSELDEESVSSMLDRCRSTFNSIPTLKDLVKNGAALDSVAAQIQARLISEERASLHGLARDERTYMDNTATTPCVPCIHAPAAPVAPAGAAGPAVGAASASSPSWGDIGSIRGAVAGFGDRSVGLLRPSSAVATEARTAGGGADDAAPWGDTLQEALSLRLQRARAWLEKVAEGCPDTPHSISHVDEEVYTRRLFQVCFRA